MALDKKCSISDERFLVTDKDLAFYKKIDVPVPTLSPLERQRRRLAWCNERRFYSRTCDLSAKPMLSMFPASSPRRVYHVSEWWSDKWDPFSYGRDFSFSRPFFEQFEELARDVPHPSLNVTYSNIENSDYVNYAGNLRDCYLVYDSDYNRSCFYCYTICNSVECVDCLKCNKCELCYECTDCELCYNLRHSVNCSNCTDSWLLKNCVGCSNCFGSANLTKRTFCFFNEQLSKEEYQARISALNLSSRKNIEILRGRAEEIWSRFPEKSLRGYRSFNSSGDGLYNCKNTVFSFDCIDCEDCAYCHSISLGGRNAYDIYQFGENLQFCYDSSILGYGAFNLRFCFMCFTGVKDLTYCQLCISSHDLFGCVGLRHKGHCILNKAYPADDYEKLRYKIIEHMKETGEWGEYFPIEHSPHAYNASMAQEHFPLSKEQVTERGYRWSDEADSDSPEQQSAAPDTIGEVEDSITQKTLACALAGKRFRIIRPELLFYRRQDLPLPICCPDERHLRRLSYRNPRRLWQRLCDSCGKPMLTSVMPERKVSVYCEDCYQEAFFA